MRIFLAALAFLAVGCSTDVPAQPEVTDKERFLEVVKSEYPSLENASDRLLVKIAKITCRALDAGASIEQIILVAVDAGMPPEEGGFVMGAGIAAFCPEHAGALDSGSTV